MSFENTDCVFLTENEGKAEDALERYFEDRGSRTRDASGSYRYFILEEEQLTVIEDIRIGNESIYNIGIYGEEMKIERNVDYEEVKVLLGDY